MKDNTFQFLVIGISLLIFGFSLLLLNENEKRYQSCLTYAIEHKMTIEDKIKVCG